ncbi:MAG: TetR/AcrR family transcriptional repressor of nem operon [Psychrobacter glaciei]
MYFFKIFRYLGFHSKTIGHIVVPMSRPRRSEHVRESLIQIGIEQFSEHGYHGTGIKQILDQVGVPKGSFYNFFASKEAFVAELIERYSHGYLLQVKEYVAGVGKPLSPVNQLTFIYRFSLEQYKQVGFKQSCLVGSMAAEISAESPMCRAALEKTVKEWRVFFTAMFEQGQEAGEIRQDISASALSETYWAAWEGALIIMKMSADTKPAIRIMDLMLKTLLKAS